MVYDPRLIGYRTATFSKDGNGGIKIVSVADGPDDVTQCPASFTRQIAVQWEAAGSETLVVRETVNATGCYSDASLLVTIKQRPAPTINGPTAQCSGRDENYNVAALSGRTYAWVAPSMGEIISGQGTAVVRIRWSSTGTGSISLREAVNGVAGCFADVTLSVTVSGSPTPVIEGKANPTEGSKKNYTVSAVSGSTYKWLQPTLGVIDGSSTAAKVKIKWTAQGTDVVRVQETITATGCMTEVSLAVSVGAAKSKSDKNAANSDGDDLDEYTSNVGSFISVDPNPTTGTATVTVAAEGALLMRIVDVRGRSVFEQRLPSAVLLEPRMITLDLSFLSTDLYRLLLISDQGVTSTPLQIMR